MPNDEMKPKYDLEERTAKFGESIIRFAKTIPKNNVTAPIISQLVRAGTSIGANYAEADDAESRKDFIHKIGIAKKEARETKHWLRMTGVAEPAVKDDTLPLLQEAKELHLIFNAITHTAKLNIRHSLGIRN